jgi:hypothetical protein
MYKVEAMIRQTLNGGVIMISLLGGQPPASFRGLATLRAYLVVSVTTN